MELNAAEPPGVPFTDQSTVLSTAFDTPAWNFSGAPNRILGAAGFSVIAGFAMTFSVRLPDEPAPGSGFVTAIETD